MYPGEGLADSPPYTLGDPKLEGLTARYYVSPSALNSYTYAGTTTTFFQTET